MQVKWGNKNESLTLTVGSGAHYEVAEVNVSFDKMCLALVAKQMSDLYQLKHGMAQMVNYAVRDSERSKAALKAYKKQGFFFRILNFIFTK